MNTGEPLVTSASSECERELAGLVGKITGVEAPQERESWWARLRQRRTRAIRDPLPADALEALVEDDAPAQPAPIAALLAGVES